MIRRNQECPHWVVILVGAASAANYQMMTKQTPISCDLYDYIEIACLHHYDVTVSLDDGRMITGRATTTRAGTDKVEYFVISVDGELTEVPMHLLSRLETNTPAASFTHVDFQAEATEE